MLTTAPRGTKDILPDEVYIWQYIENVAREIAGKYGYREIRTPTFEHTELFQRGVGDTTDIVQKEMYTFEDKGGRSITLRPEGTASVVRAFIQNKLTEQPQPTKLYYIISAFRYERPQAGRMREFHQFGVEVFGSDDPSIDAEAIDMAMSILNKVGLKGLKLKINSIGCAKCRADYNRALKDFLKVRLDKLCDNCKVRYEKNPLRVLDCKNPSCQEQFEGVPVILDYLCDDCKNHFSRLQNRLDLLDIKYEVDPSIVRGLDYYTKTAFEIISEDIGTQNAVCGGGRYDGLVKACGGPDMPGVGFAMGLERLILTIKAQNIQIPKANNVEVFIVAIGEQADDFAYRLAKQLRDRGISCDKDYMGRSIKAQLKYADKINSQYVLIIGDEEIKKGFAILKHMVTGNQREVPFNQLVDVLKDVLKN
ncbi:histidyl-tRNA synthetase [Caldanaerobius fijiensis DSM 17918]|uniref:Histidine--tRNA ligase n=1 Tax=Caldanaerobius fijiensis DSM 17918 TaxID=1121256 RepID=A0A1M4TZ98_9THEO|nr:histidine--tRNA ligase [Caldanaerobius fijiensis]SHE49693.1 histidyl-tRNA synthetase [Caldanaerobius fijiensis DSM 17918]